MGPPLGTLNGDVCGAESMRFDAPFWGSFGVFWGPFAIRGPLGVDLWDLGSPHWGVCPCRMPWQGDTNNMIDRFDVRAHLDYIPMYTPPLLNPM